MTAGERFKSWIDATFTSWGDRLATWGMSLLARGATLTLEDMEPEVKESAQVALASLLASPVVPDEIKDKIRSASSAGNILETIYLEAIMILQSFGVILGGSTPIANELRYAQDFVKRSSRLDPISVITAWRRDPEAYAQYFEDLKEQGWSDERIEALKFVTLFMPTPQDLVNWQAKEVFEPEMIARYGLDSEFGGLDLSLFAKLGVTEEQALNYWRAHWEHASFNQVIEMLHRGTLTLDKTMPTPPTTKEGWATRDAEGEQALYDWYRLVEIPPFWRDRLTAMSWNVPTRVDVRRWWDMRTISEEELRNVYHRQGYHGTDLDNYVKWTKVYTDFPMMMTRFSRGWINEDDIRTWLRGLEIPEDRITQFIQEKTWPEKAAKTATERDITKTDIIKGVKQGVISRREGIELLVDMNYDEDEADYILTINIPMDEEDVVVKEREVTKTDIIAGLKAEVITESQARAKLIELRYSGVDADFLLDIFKATIKPPTEPRQREASKADILKAVKKGLLSPEEGYLMLLDLGFTPEASQFILEVHAEESPFSPINYTEFKDLTAKYKKAVGRETKEMPEELKSAAAKVIEVTKDIEALNVSIKEEEALLVDEEIIPEEAQAKLKELQVARNRAEAELFRIKSEYDRLVAEWKHGLP